MSISGTADHKVLVLAQFQYQTGGTLVANVALDGANVCVPDGYSGWKVLGNSAQNPETRQISCLVTVPGGDHYLELNLQGTGQLDSAQVIALDQGTAS